MVIFILRPEQDGGFFAFAGNPATDKLCLEVARTAKEEIKEGYHV